MRFDPRLEILEFMDRGYILMRHKYSDVAYLKNVFAKVIDGDAFESLKTEGLIALDAETKTTEFWKLADLPDGTERWAQLDIHITVTQRN